MPTPTKPCLLIATLAMRFGGPTTFKPPHKARVFEVEVIKEGSNDSLL